MNMPVQASVAVDAVVPPIALLTAEQYSELPDLGYPSELVRGKIVKMNRPFTSHGVYCAEIARVLGNFTKQHDLGRVVCNDSGVITEHDPDTVRGADVAFYSYQKVPKSPMPKKYFDPLPELVFEVVSDSDRWNKVLQKVSEYLNAGVQVVCVVDPETRTAQVFENDRPPVPFGPNDELTFRELLTGFRLPLKSLFE